MKSIVQFPCYRIASAFKKDERDNLYGNNVINGIAGELRFIQSGGRIYVQGDTNGDGISDFMSRLEDLHVLDVGDFLL